MEEQSINWAAFAVAVVAQMIIGAIWYHPAVMGKRYAKSLGIAVEDLNPGNPAVTYGITILMSILFTFFLMANVTGPGQWTAPDGHSFVTFGHGVFHGVVILICVLMPIFSAPALFEKRGMAWYLIHVGHWALRAIIACGILSAWR